MIPLVQLSGLIALLYMKLKSLHNIGDNIVFDSINISGINKFSPLLFCLFNNQKLFKLQLYKNLDPTDRF